MSLDKNRSKRLVVKMTPPQIRELINDTLDKGAMILVRDPEETTEQD